MATAPATSRHSPRRMTAAEYMAMPDDGNKYELLHGELMMSPSYLHPHSRVAVYITRKLDEFVEARLLGYVGIETDVVMGKNIVLRPDVHFISKRNARIIRGHLYGPPDLVVEVTSPSNWQTDLHDKRDEYERFGVREYWVFDIAEGRDRAFQWHAKAGIFHGGLVAERVLKSKVLRGFSLQLPALWKRAAETR